MKTAGDGEAAVVALVDRGPAKNGVEGWRDPEVAGRPVMRHFSAEYKRQIVEEAARCQPGELGSTLRREGIYSSALSRWRKQYAAGVLMHFSEAVGQRHSRLE